MKAAAAVAAAATVTAMTGYKNDNGDEDESIGDSSSRRRLRETEALQLKKILEWELSLDARDLRSHAWYHGAIGRAKAEQIVAQQDGDFLVRDCTSQPGNYVLSCRSKGQNLHFVINKIVLQPDTVYESVQYRFEDEGFDTVPDLITYYVGSGKPITVASAARIQNPQNRRYPLSFCSDASTAAAAAVAATNAVSSCGATTTTTFCGSYSPTARRRIFAITTMHKKRRDLSSRYDGGRDGGGGSMQMTSTLRTRETGVTSDVSFSASLPRQRASNRAVKIRCSSFCAETEPSQPHYTSKCTSDAPASTDPMRGHSRCLLRRHRNGGVGHDTVCDRDDDFESNKVSVDVDVHVDCDIDVDVEPPPKPSRIFKNWSSSDSGNGSDDSVQSCDAINGGGGGGGGDDDCRADMSSRRKMSGVIIKNPKYYPPRRDIRTEEDGDLGCGDIARHDIDDATEAAATTTISTASATNSSKSKVSERNNDDDDDDDEHGISYGLARVNVAPASTEARTVDANEAAACKEEEEVKWTLASSAFDLDAFHTLLLPAAENKPLDTCALQGVHMLLMESGSRMLANHLTRADLELTVNDLDADLDLDHDHDRDRDHDKGLGHDNVARNTCRTGIELSVLPQGRRRRLDLIERSECLRLLVAVTVLTCATELERAELLNKWIEVAIETKTALGNLYGFCGIMLGLCSPQVQRLSETWHILRQRYTDSAFNFEAKLRPTLKCMNESTNPLAPNTTIPHLLPVVLLYETNDPSSRVHASHDDDDDDVVKVENTYVWDVCVNRWEASSPDLGLSTLYSHLNATRQFYNSLPTFRRNAEIVLTDSKMDHLLRDVFRTEFHLKFLWGSRGAKANPTERYYKFHQVLNVMSEKCESETVHYDGSLPAATSAGGRAAAAAAAASESADSLSPSYNDGHATSV